MGNEAGNGTKSHKKRNHHKRSDQPYPHYPTYDVNRQRSGQRKPARGGRSSALKRNHHPKGGRGGQRN